MPFSAHATQAATYPTTTLPEAVGAVRRYYDRNTRLFRALGLGVRARAIRRAVWDASVTSLDDALEQVNALIVREVPVDAGATRHDLRILDLGCGVGGSLAYLAHALPCATLAGLTISACQARLARRAVPWSRAIVVEGDFHALPFAARFTVALAVEAFAHSPEPQRCYAEAAHILVPGGRLIVCDDFIAREPADADERRWLEAFRAGWRVAGLQTTGQAIAIAGQAGLALRTDHDLTACLRFHTLPSPLNAMTRQVTAVAGRAHPFLHSLHGSLALQECLARGLVHYRLLVFERQAAWPAPGDCDAS